MGTKGRYHQATAYQQADKAKIIAVEIMVAKAGQGDFDGLIVGFSSIFQRDRPFRKLMDEIVLYREKGGVCHG